MNNWCTVIFNGVKTVSTGKDYSALLSRYESTFYYKE